MKSKEVTYAAASGERAGPEECIGRIHKRRVVFVHVVGCGYGVGACSGNLRPVDGIGHLSREFGSLLWILQHLHGQFSRLFHLIVYVLVTC